ncbi:unnamed protein product [marine sediment metagenome]|uniref:Uncharacterized protein n=1 Tax=marine sediment metagenome TaxID=412755 RepID=X1HM51_9ZZZZ
MSERKCKRCGRIEYGIWGRIGLVGYSLIIGAFAYAIASSFYFNFRSLVIVALVFGVILWLPMWFISIHEEREEKNNAEKKQ